MSQDYSVYSFAEIEGLRNSIRRPTMEHVASCGVNVALGDFVWLAQATVISHGGGDGPQGSKGQRDRSKIQIEAWFGQCLSYSENEDGTVMVLWNLYSRKNGVPDTVNRIGMNIIPDDMIVVQTNLFTNQPITDIQSVAVVYHFQQFNHFHHGKLNVFADCVAGNLSPLLLESHRASSDSVHMSAQSQLPTNLFRVFVHPGVWKMIKNDMQDNFLSTTHPFYIDQVEVTVKKKSIQFADEVLYLVTETVPTLPSHYIDHIKVYTNKLMIFIELYLITKGDRSDFNHVLVK
jgi:hypothetical protein